MGGELGDETHINLLIVSSALYIYTPNVTMIRNDVKKNESSFNM